MTASVDLVSCAKAWLALDSTLCQMPAQGTSWVWLVQPPPCIWTLTLFGYSAFVVQLLDQANQKQEAKLSWVASFVSCVLTGFGGSIVVCLLLGRVTMPFSNEYAISLMFAAWFVHHSSFTSGVWAMFISTFVGQTILQTLFEIFRCGVLTGWVETSFKELSPNTATLFGMPVVGPIICGTIGSCGGMFFPFSKGLQPIQQSVPWLVESGFIATVVYFVSAHVGLPHFFVPSHPGMATFGNNVVQLSSEVSVAFFTIDKLDARCLTVFVMIVGRVCPPAALLLEPLHTALYSILGMGKFQNLLEQ